MKFKAAENSVFGSAMIEPLERAAVASEFRSAKWLVWHGKGGKSVARIKALGATLMAKLGYEFSTPWWNLHRMSCDLRNNTSTLANYGARHRRGLPISSSIAESAVNLVVSHRMAKKQQMRWTDYGAHCLAQVRVAALNGELSPARQINLGTTSEPTCSYWPNRCDSGAETKQDACARGLKSHESDDQTSFSPDQGNWSFDTNIGMRIKTRC
jgi:hypothetical protein